MDHKKSPKGKRKTKQQLFEESLWECSACTYRNNPEAFKCSMCGIRKGTSTRKPKLNPDMLEVQVQKHAFAPPPLPHARLTREEIARVSEGGSKSGGGASGSESGRPSSSASNDPSYDDEEEPGPSTPTPKTKKLKLPPVPKGKHKPGSSNNGVGSNGSTPHFGSTPVIGRGGRIRNLDRKSATGWQISVDDVTINITEYKLKPPRKEKKGSGAASGAGGDAEGGSGAATVNNSDGESDSQDTRTT